MKLSNNRRRAFTLTEIAIVLGIVGLILSAIWVVAGKVRTRHKINLLVMEVSAIINGFRQLYHGGLPDAGDLTPLAIQMGMCPQAPAAWLPTPRCSGPWDPNNFIQIFGAGNGDPAASDSIVIDIGSLSPEACVGVMTALGINGPGLETSKIIAVDHPGGVKEVDSLLVAPYNLVHFTTAQIIDTCTATANTDEVQLYYSIR